MTDWVIGKVKKVHFWTDVLFSLIIRAPIHPFIAGQFTKLSLKIDGKRIQRAYSYVNSPENPNLEFYLVSIPKGKFSFCLSMLKPGDEVQVMSKASGFFILDTIPDCDTLWMFATGTALGPYLSILESGKELDRFKNIVLVHAVRYVTDLSYTMKIISLKERYKDKLHIQTIISRENIVGSLFGRIPFLIKSGVLEKSIGLSINAQTSHVMLCGNPKMVRDTQQLLIETRQMTKNLRHQSGHITTEHYW